jgi:beta-lactamase superfamily II metal-dependent hydrolase
MSTNLHFLNVGNGDCSIIELPDGNLMMVDICNGGGTNWQKTDPLRYLDLLGKGSPILRYVQTYPEMDHMDGLAALARKCSITNFWDTANTRARPDFSSRFGKGKPEDWDAYHRLRQTAKHHSRGVSPVTLQGGGQLPYELYTLHPTEQAVRDANRTGEWNNAAYVLLLKERGFKALIAGDIDDGVWEELHVWASRDRTARDLVSGICVFKVSHHGRRSGYCGADWLNLTNPNEIVISKGSVPGEHSAYGNYYNYKNGAEHLWLSSQGDLVCSYDSDNNKYTINQRR